MTNGNPYQCIHERNVFGLRQPRVITPLPTVTPPTITLTGITTIFGDKRALLKIQLPARPPARPREEPCILLEGQQSAGVEVLDIDEKTGTVRVSSSGVVTELTFDKNGVRPPAAALSPANTRTAPSRSVVGAISSRWSPPARMATTSSRYR